jgi:hypothetical protein
MGEDLLSVFSAERHPSVIEQKICETPYLLQVLEKIWRPRWDLKPCYRRERRTVLKFM